MQTVERLAGHIAISTHMSQRMRLALTLAGAAAAIGSFPFFDLASTQEISTLSSVVYSIDAIAILILSGFFLLTAGFSESRRIDFDGPQKQAVITISQPLGKTRTRRIPFDDILQLEAIDHSAPSDNSSYDIRLTAANAFPFEFGEFDRRVEIDRMLDDLKGLVNKETESAESSSSLGNTPISSAQATVA